MRIGMVGCVKQKRSATSAARDLYTSPLFCRRRSHVEATCEAWVILSALHGVVLPDEVLDPYDRTLKTVSASERRRWAGDVLADLERYFGPLRAHVFELHAGSEYVDFGLEEGLRRAGAGVDRPLQGLSLGRQLAWYSGSHSERGRTVSAGPRGDEISLGHSYAMLREALDRAAGDVTWSFTDIEEILGRDLPASARRHRAWWANDGKHSQAAAWLAAGYRVGRVALDAQHVTFARTP